MQRLYTSVDNLCQQISYTISSTYAVNNAAYTGLLTPNFLYFSLKVTPILTQQSFSKALIYNIVSFVPNPAN